MPSTNWVDFRYKRRRPPPKKEAIVKDLLERVWGVSPPAPATESEFIAYVDHYEHIARQTVRTGHELIRLVDSRNQSGDIIELVRLVQNYSRHSLKDIKAALRARNPAWLRDSGNDAHVNEAVNAAIQLWLFSRISFDDEDAPLQSALKRSLPQDSAPSSGTLTFDFSAKNLTRKGGFTFTWTSDLSRHLTFASKYEIYFFRHGRVLDVLSRSQYANVFPARFLNEARRTFRLFFPTEAVKDAKRTHKIERLYDVDLEVQIALQERLQLKEYPYFSKRLSVIQNEYNAARPTRIRQWWFDRRNRVEWVTLLIAVIVFILTLVFGTISSVTGIIQVYATFKWH